MLEIFRSKPEEKPKNESQLMGDRVRTENEALLRAEKHYLYNPTDEEVQGELMEEAKIEDENRLKAA